jgi:hypothetical protein
MFGRRTDTRRTRGSGVLGSSNLRKAAIAGVGMLALQWWRNRQAKRPGELHEPDARDDMIRPM